jgi:hypothetical protein
MPTASSSRWTPTRRKKVPLGRREQAAHDRIGQEHQVADVVGAEGVEDSVSPGGRRVGSWRPERLIEIGVVTTVPRYPRAMPRPSQLGGRARRALAVAPGRAGGRRGRGAGARASRACAGALAGRVAAAFTTAAGASRGAPGVRQLYARRSPRSSIARGPERLASPTASGKAWPRAADARTIAVAQAPRAVPVSDQGADRRSARALRELVSGLPIEVAVLTGDTPLKARRHTRGRPASC